MTKKTKMVEWEGFSIPVELFEMISRKTRRSELAGHIRDVFADGASNDVNLTAVKLWKTTGTIYPRRKIAGMISYLVKKGDLRRVSYALYAATKHNVTRLKKAA